MNETPRFGISQPVRRVEDLRFLNGHGEYVEDVKLEGELRLFVLRSPVAHADFTIDAAAAREAPGVHLVLTGVDLDEAMDNDIDALTLPNVDGRAGRSWPGPACAMSASRSPAWSPIRWRWRATPPS
jgi:carbon-monoxide dehydrogenase large subunit